MRIVATRNRHNAPNLQVQFNKIARLRCKRQSPQHQQRYMIKSQPAGQHTTPIACCLKKKKRKYFVIKIKW